ncbi:MAG: hypothetical protein ACTSRS_21825 [Candidatus Helarchaeota archaeon]
MTIFRAETLAGVGTTCIDKYSSTAIATCALYLKYFPYLHFEKPHRALGSVLGAPLFGGCLQWILRGGETNAIMRPYI